MKSFPQKKIIKHSSLFSSVVLLRMMLLLMITTTISSCKKSSTSTFDLTTSTTPTIYPSKIVYSTNLFNVFNNYGIGPVTLYTYTYNPSLKLINLNVRYGNSTADTIYNKITYDASNRLTQLGTNNNSTATMISYDNTGNVSQITQNYRAGTANTSDIRNFKYASGQITESTKQIAGAATASIDNIFTTDTNGNITGATLNNGASSTQVTVSYYGSQFPNAFYGLSKNGLFAFLPEQLWTNIEFIIFSKNLVKTVDSPGNYTQNFTYQFDALNRISVVTNTINVPNSTVPYVLTHTLSYAN